MNNIILSNDRDKLIIARVNDLIDGVIKQSTPRFIGFLDLRQKSLMQRELNRFKFNNYFFYGGYEEAERVYLGIFPDYLEYDFYKNSDGLLPPELIELFPFGLLEISWKFKSLTHGDFLGALTALGIKRETIGDIVVTENKAFVFLEKPIMRFVLQNLEKVGSTGVNCNIYDDSVIIPKNEYKEIFSTVSSARLDCAVSALLNVSRNESETLIKSGKISVNFEVVQDNDHIVNDGVTVSIRGHGRFMIDAVGPITKKGRLKFSAKKYL